MYHQAYIQFLIHFHTDRDYFECHEILEDYWKEDTPPFRKKYLVGLIQVAVGMYHYRRGNLIGAKRVLNHSIKIIINEFEDLTKLGIIVPELLDILYLQLEQIELNKPYYSFNIPLNQSLFEYCSQNQLNFGQQSDMSNTFLIHKHKLRDRTEIIQIRNSKLNKKSASALKDFE